MKDREPGLKEVWNVWFTLMLVVAAFTIGTLILEALGILKDLARRARLPRTSIRGVQGGMVNRET